jgi:hypothetical protein
VADHDIGRPHAGGGKKRAQVSKDIACTARHRRGVAAAALVGLVAGDSSWAMIGADAGELSDAVEDRRFSRALRLHDTPNVAIAGAPASRMTVGLPPMLWKGEISRLKPSPPHIPNVRPQPTIAGSLLLISIKTAVVRRR